MFEKEAEEYYESKPVHTYVDSLGFFHDLEGIKQAYIQGRLDERKANEWHYPSKGEYPKDEKNVLCILGDFENIDLEVGYYSQKENERERWRFSEYSTPDDSEDAWGVSAWKEIVPPELKESE